MGFSLRNMKPRTRFLSSGVISISRSGRSVSRWTLARFSRSCSRSSSAVFIFFKSFSTRSSRFSTCPKSLTIRSKSIFLISRSGSIGPTCAIESSSKARTT